jgi:hypothetical protein
MLNRLVAVTAFVLVLSLLSGCFRVRMREPIANRTDAPLAEALRGVWVIGDDALHVDVDESGQLRAATVDFRDGKFVLEEQVAIATVTDAGWLLAFRNEEKEVWGLATFSINTSGNTLVGAEANPSWFKRAIERGDLQGTVSSNGQVVSLSSSRAEVIAAIKKAIENDEAPFKDFVSMVKLGGR